VSGTQTLTNKTLTNPAINGFTGDTSVINIGSGQLYKDASGNVGIGTSSPTQRLHVQRSSYGVTGLFQTEDGTGNPRLAIYGSSAGTTIQNTWSSGASNLIFANGGAVGSGTEAMRITSAGNVGIAKSDPQYSLDMGGSGLAAVGFSGTAVDSVGYRVGQGVVGVTNSGFSIRDTTAGATRMVIDSSGNLLVGTAAGNGSKFEVYASSEIARFYNTSGQGTIRFVDGINVTKGSIVWDGSTTAYNTSSDYRLKNTIAPMTGALAKVAALKPVTYKWNADDSQSQGFIAHELQEVVPECVTGEKDAVDAEGNPQYQGIDTSFLVATLTAAIQEQQAIINDLKARLDAANL
jgi:hypothetical protein